MEIEKTHYPGQMPELDNGAKPGFGKGATTDGTTILSVVYDGGVMVAADTYSTAGVLIGNRVSDKLEPLHQRIYAQRTGTSAHTAAVCQILRYYLDVHTSELGSLPQVESAAKMAQKIFNENTWMSGGLIVSGWDPVKGYSIWNVSAGCCFEKKFAMSGSGSIFIVGHIEKAYRENMSRAEAEEFLKECVTLASYKDGSSGGCIRIMDITQERLQRHFVKWNDKTLK